MTETTSKHIILYAEDDIDDFDAVKEVVEQLSDEHQIVNAKNGNEAIKYLQEHAASLPSLIILDLNMPIMDGKEVLAWIKSQELYAHIPVMVFTTSSREEDVKLCQRHSCIFYRKPTLYRDLLHIVQTMLQLSEDNLATGK